VCVSTFEDANGNGKRDEGENLIAGAVVVLSNTDRLEIARYTTDGLSEPYCFSGLAEGTYYLKRQNPAGYVSTVPDDWAVAVMPGGKTMVEMGARFVPTPSPTRTVTATATPTATPTPRSFLRETAHAVYQISGLILAALALSIPFGLRYLRKRL
jgi:hypothetical protein